MKITSSVPRPFLVTGASGFLGQHIVRVLRERGYPVWAATHNYQADREDRTACFDVSNATQVREAVQEIQPKYVINCAAYGVDARLNESTLSIRTNATGPADFFQICDEIGVEHFIHLGSCFEYGHSNEPLTESHPLRPTTQYGATKALGTFLLQRQSESSRTHLTILRPFGLWGAGEPAYRLVPQILLACQQQKVLQLTSCDQLRDYSYIEDIANWIVDFSLIHPTSTGSVINLGTGRSICLKDFVMEIATLLKGEHLMKFGELPYRHGEMMSVVANVHKMHSILPVPHLTSISSGLKKMGVDIETICADRNFCL